MNEFQEYLREHFAGFGDIHFRRMFGGYGLFHQGLMLALIVGDELYLKADPVSIAHFAALDLDAFQYRRQGKLVQLSFYRAPESVFDDAEEATVWLQRAFEAALRNQPGARAAKSKRTIG